VVEGDVFCHAEYRDGKLSITGVVAPTKCGNARGGCGQIDMEFQHANDGVEELSKRAYETKDIEFAQGWTSEVWYKFLDIWDLWHLNDMKATCEHQRAEGWDKLVGEKINIYQWQLKPEISTKKKELESEAIERAKTTGKKYVEFYAQDKKILGLEEFIKTNESELKELARYYEPTHHDHGYFAHVEEKTRGWVTEKEHPLGLLSKPCKVCGYEYGSKWNHVDVPMDVLKFLVALPNTDKTPAWV
jgi:hypothetical protein